MADTIRDDLMPQVFLSWHVISTRCPRCEGELRFEIDSPKGGELRIEHLSPPPPEAGEADDCCRCDRNAEEMRLLARAGALMTGVICKHQVQRVAALAAGEVKMRLVRQDGSEELLTLDAEGVRIHEVTPQAMDSISRSIHEQLTGKRVSSDPKGDRARDILQRTMAQADGRTGTGKKYDA